jgi:hypothetical protein
MRLSPTYRRTDVRYVTPFRSSPFPPHRPKAWIGIRRELFQGSVGLYLDPPENALVLCCDAKLPCQVLERTQARLPLEVGRIGTRTHD